jgi:hypothetical protein
MPAPVSLFHACPPGEADSILNEGFVGDVLLEDHFRMVNPAVVPGAVEVAVFAVGVDGLDLAAYESPGWPQGQYVVPAAVLNGPPPAALVRGTPPAGAIFVRP